MTLFEFHVATATALDLTTPPLVRDRAPWTHPMNYTVTQALAVTALEAGLALIRYASVRHARGVCLAVMDPAPFRAVKQP